MKVDTSLVVLWGGVAALILITWRTKGWTGVRADSQVPGILRRW